MSRPRHQHLRRRLRPLRQRQMGKQRRHLVLQVLVVVATMSREVDAQDEIGCAITLDATMLLSLVI